MVDIQSAAAEIRRGKKEDRKKPQGKDIMVCPIPQGDHKNVNMLNLLNAPRIRYISRYKQEVYTLTERLL